MRPEPSGQARRARRLVTPALAAFVVIVLAATAAVLVPARRIALAVAPDPRTARGALHVHTNRSDGTGTIDSVAAAASAAGLQFVVLSDHGDGTRQPEAPSYRAGVLCIDAVEISADGGHYLALGLSRAPYRLAGEPRDVIADVRRLGGFGIATHPASSKPDLRWRDWLAPFDGLEWLNADSEWRDERRRTLVRALATYGLRAPETIAAVFDRPVGVLERWDRAAMERKVIGAAGHDAHARIGLRGNWEPTAGEPSLRLPSYEAAFRAFSVQVPLEAPLTGDAARDAAAVLRAIREGRLYTVIDAVAGPARFAFEARANGVAARAGDELDTAEGVNLEARTTPAPGLTLVLLRNGTAIHTQPGATLSYWHEPGTGRAVYRVEARLQAAPGQPPVPWIVGNPIWIGPPFRPEVAPVRPVVWHSVWDPTMLERWRVERDTTSRGALAPATMAWGPAVRFDFALGGGAPAGQYAAAALVAGRPTFAPADRVSVRLAASSEMRLSLQLRDPASGRRWRRSLVVEARPAVQTVFFDDFRPVETAMAGPMPKAGLDSLLFVVDTVNTPPGTQGTVWVGEVVLGQP